MTGRQLTSQRHELQIYPGRIDWGRVLGALAGLALIVAIIGGAS